VRQGSKFGLVLTLLLTAVVFAGLVVPAAAAGTKFTDVSGHWAEQPILEMSGYGIVHGYPGGKFAPDNPVTFIEAVVMVLNTVGLGDEAVKTPVAGLSFHPGVTWGKEYLALAVREGMVREENLPKLETGRPAYRYEVASLVYHALDLKPDVNLPFADAATIPEKYRTHVGAVAGQGIMRGLPGSLFAPYMRVTRAQMCAILFRLIEEGLVEPPRSLTRLTGRVLSLDGGNLKVSNLAGERVVLLPPDCPVGRGNKTVDRNAVAQGERIRLVVGEDNKARYAYLLGEYGTAVKVASGIVNGMIPGRRDSYRLTLQNEFSSTETYDVYGDALVLKNGREARGAAIAPDVFVKLSLDQNNGVFRVEGYELTKVSGTITNIEASSLTLRSRGTKTDYLVPRNVRVTRNIIRDIPYGELKSGDRVDLWVAGDTVLRIDFLSGIIVQLSGMISKVHTKEVYIFVRNEEKCFNLNEQVEICKDGSTVTKDQLKRGDYVIFEVDSGQTVSYIEIINEDEGEFEGTVKELDAYNRSLSFDLAGGLEMDYRIAGGARFYRSGDEINLADIVPGAKVLVAVEEHKITEIIVIDDRNITFTGLVANYNSDARRVTIEVNGYLRTYSLSSGATVKDRNGKVVGVADLKGYTVEAKLVEGVINALTGI
jgi:hypothetical protein